MYLRSWLIQLNRSYKYNENIARTGISTLNGHISETKNDNPKVPKFSSFRGLSFTLWRKCGSTTLYAIFGLYGSVFGHFLGVRGVAQCGSMAQNMPLGPLETGEPKHLCYFKYRLAPLTIVAFENVFFYTYLPEICFNLQNYRHKLGDRIEKVVFYTHPINMFPPSKCLAWILW